MLLNTDMVFATAPATGGSGNYSLLIMLGLAVVLVFVMSRSSKKRVAQAQEQRQKMMSELTAGTWVRTTSGFYGKIVELHDEVVVLAGLTGEETVWDLRSITGANEPNFGDQPEVDQAGQDLGLDPKDGKSSQEREADMNTEPGSQRPAQSLPEGHDQAKYPDQGSVNEPKDVDFPAGKDSEDQNK